MKSNYNVFATIVNVFLVLVIVALLFYTIDTDKAEPEPIDHSAVLIYNWYNAEAIKGDGLPTYGSEITDFVKFSYDEGMTKEEIKDKYIPKEHLETVIEFTIVK